MLAVQITAPWGDLALTVVATVAALLAVLLLTRIYGLRTFAKMAPFDFAATIAIGSLLAGAAMGSVPLLQGLVALGTLYAMQRVLALARRHGGQPVLDNTPVLLMAGSEVLHDNLGRGNVTLDDLRAKLREANVLDYDDIRAVVLETTGDISVLHADGDASLNRDLLDNVGGMPSSDPDTWHRGAELAPTE